MFGAFGSAIVTSQHWENSFDPNNLIIQKNTNMPYNIPHYKQMNVLENKSTGSKIKLKKPIMFRIEVDKNGIYYNNDEYNIYACGNTQGEAENDVYEEFLFNYESYAEEDDDRLDEKAKLLKYKLLKICGDISA